MKKFQRLSIAVAVIFLGALPAIRKLEASAAYNQREFFVEEKIELKGFPKGVNNLGIWIPYPVSDQWQKVSDFKLAGPFDYKLIEDKKYGNRIIYLKPDKNIPDKTTAEITLSFRVKRKEYGLPFTPPFLHSNYLLKERAGFTLPGREKDLSRFLKSNRLVPVNGEVKKLAEKIANGKNSGLEKARAIYDYLIDELTYSKDDPKVCGIGDSLLTLQYLKGICTDYHSLFISLVRSLGIPAKFEIGFPIPARAKEHTQNGYHCWAKFYLKGKGWIPVDISEADKHPQKRDYFFGHIDENRVHFTTGRDIQLAYTKNSEPLNFFIYPYAELNGSEFFNLNFEITFRDQMKTRLMKQSEHKSLSEFDPPPLFETRRGFIDIR